MSELDDDRQRVIETAILFVNARGIDRRDTERSLRAAVRILTEGKP